MPHHFHHVLFLWLGRPLVLGLLGKGFFVLVGSADLQSELPVITSNNVLDDLGTSNPRQENGRQASHATGWNVGH